MTEDQLLRKIKHSESFYDPNLKLSEKEVEVRINEDIESENNKKDNQPVTILKLYSRSIPINKQIPRKIKDKNLHKVRSISAFEKNHHEHNKSDNNAKTERFVEYRKQKGRDSLDIPQIGRKAPTPNQLIRDPSLNSNFIYIDDEIQFVKRSHVNSPKILHDYFELSEEQV